MALTIEKMRENILRLLGHILRREKTKAVRVVKRIYFEEKRGRENQKRGEGYNREQYDIGGCKWRECGWSSIVEVKNSGG